MGNAFLAVYSVLVVYRLIVSQIRAAYHALSCKQFNRSGRIRHILQMTDLPCWLLMAFAGHATVVSHATPIISEVVIYSLCWESICFNLLITGGLFKVCLLGVIIPAHAASQFIFMEIISVLIVN
jgi:hypothetical protein